MKLSFLRPLTSCFVVGIVLATAPPASAEYIVGSQVVSDEVAAPGTIPDGSSTHSYVGDMSAGEAGFAGAGSAVGMNERTYGRPDLFYNFYTQGHANRANAQMYMSPHPVPPNVGHTFFTYQPFYPHEYLYKHTDRFHNYYDNGRGLNRTRAVYGTTPVRQGISNLYRSVIRLPH